MATVMSVVTSTPTMAQNESGESQNYPARACVPSRTNKEYRFRVDNLGGITNTDTADALTVVCPIVKDQEFNCWSWLLALMGRLRPPLSASRQRPVTTVNLS